MIIRDVDDAVLKEVVDDFNKILLYLEAQKIDSLSLSRDLPASSTEHFISLFDWLTHLYLRSTVNLCRNYANAVSSNEDLAAAILGRAIIEAIAHFNLLLDSLEKDMASGRHDEAYYLVASHLLGGKNGPNPAKAKYKTLHVMDSIRHVAKTHNWIMDYCHSEARVDKAHSHRRPSLLYRALLGS